MTENIIQVISFNFSLKLLKIIYKLEKFQFDPVLKQLLRSGTSIGANVEEALGAQSKQDFVHKFSIAQKRSKRNKILAQNNYGYTYLDIGGMEGSLEGNRGNK